MPETMGERIQQAISYRGLKQGEAARLIGISAQYLSDIIYGRKNASKRLKYSTAQALKISPEWLIDGVGSMEQTNAGDVSDLALLASEIINAPPTSKRKALAIAVARLSDQEVQAIDRFISEYNTQLKKTEPQAPSPSLVQLEQEQDEPQ